MLIWCQTFNTSRNRSRHGRGSSNPHRVASGTRSEVPSDPLKCLVGLDLQLRCVLKQKVSSVCWYPKKKHFSCLNGWVNPQKWTSSLEISAEDCQASTIDQKRFKSNSQRFLEFSWDMHQKKTENVFFKVQKPPDFPVPSRVGRYRLSDIKSRARPELICPKDAAPVWGRWTWRSKTCLGLETCCLIDSVCVCSICNCSF